MDSGIGWSVIAGIFSSAVVGGIVQTMMSYSFSRRLEALKKDFSSELFEKQTKFAWLHNERSRVLVRLYRLLWRVDKLFCDMTSPLQYSSEELDKAKRDEASTAANAFFHFYQKNRVFLDEDLFGKLWSIEEKYRRVWSEFVPMDNSKPDPQTWGESWKKVGEIGVILTDVRKQVQHMLGMNTVRN